MHNTHANAMATLQMQFINVASIAQRMQLDDTLAILALFRFPILILNFLAVQNFKLNFSRDLAW